MPALGAALNGRLFQSSDRVFHDRKFKNLNTIKANGNRTQACAVAM
jgi:hypothetical protein